MKLGLLGDLQLTNRGPEKRLDDYFVTQMGKLDEAFDIFDSHGCEVVIQPGDFCDSSTIANRVKSVIISFLKEKLGDKKAYCVYGQHDISGHSASTLPNSPLAVLEAAGVVKIVSDCYGIGFVGDHREICLYGASFGEEIPKVYASHEDGYHILITHRMIGDRPLWPGHELPGPRQFLRKHPSFDLIVCGDYHYRFTETYDGRTIINPGCLVRKTTGKFDLEHKPAVVIFDTDTGKSKVIELKVKPIKEIFDLAKTAEKKDNNSLLSFIEGLRNQGEKSIGWKHILLEVLEGKESSLSVKEIIDQCLEEIKLG